MLKGFRQLRPGSWRPNPSGRRCFVHIGTHKTGTTTLQIVLRDHGSELDAAGYIYPLAGRPAEHPHGQHNIAWEISGDARFRKADGTIDDLLAEISRVPHNVIVSSEDFECSLYHPQQFAVFTRRLQACNLAVVFIVYLRDRVDYAQSLYLELLRYGFVKSFNEFVDEILEDGRVSWRNWLISFCYKDLVSRLKHLADVEVIVRSYDDHKDGSLIDDYLSILGLTSSDLGILPTLRTNQRQDLISAVKCFYQNRKAAPLDDVANRVVSALFEPLKDKSLAVSEWTRSRISGRFGALTHEQFSNPGSAELVAVRQRLRVEETLWMENVFSTQLQAQIDGLVAVLAEAGGEPASGFAPVQVRSV